jgi:holo-[acyl-carrier protein] synthase
MNFIKGVGIDITKIPRFEKLMAQKYFENFLNKALHKKEIEEFHKLKTNELKSKYLASRWSYKEALVKATGNKKLIFSKVYLTKNEQGKPFITFDEEYTKHDPIIKDILNRTHVSISHEDDTSVAIVIIENKNNLI